MKTKSFNGSMEDITIISSGVKIEGKVTSNGSIRVDGSLQGDLIAKGNVTIGEQGDINGQITANVINVGGKVVGSINAREKLVLESKSSLKGDIVSKILVIEAGAKFDGKSNMGESNKGITPPNPPQQNK